MCRIDFTFNVNKEPTKNAGTPPTVKTDQIGFVQGTAVVNGNTGTGSGSSSVTVTKAAPGITTSATTSAKVGTPITDTATLSPAVPPGPAPTGTITFSLYLNDAMCNDDRGVHVDGLGYQRDGQLHLRCLHADLARRLSLGCVLQRDANNAAATTACGASGETSTMTTATPTLTTSASAPVTIGATISDGGVLAGGFNPTGLITFNVYGPNDATCSNTPAFTSTTTVAGNGTYSSAHFTATAAGTYRFIASYSGDTNNAAASGACGDANESVAVTKVTPAIITTASLAGGHISDAATLSGGAAPTGTITFNLYGPSDATCSSTPIFTSTASVSGNGSYSSNQFTPTAAGTYRFVASYSGDANNATVATACTDTGESVAYSPAAKATPAIATRASASVSVGGTISDAAALSGGSSPTGTVTFTLFGPGNTTCTGTPMFTSTVPVNGNGIYSSQAFTTTAAGNYEFVAVYGGDAANTAVASACGDANESVTVSTGTGGPPAAPRPELSEPVRIAVARGQLAAPHHQRQAAGGHHVLLHAQGGGQGHLRVHREAPGRKVKKNHRVAPTKSNRHKPSCRRTITAGTVPFTGPRTR